MGVVEDTVAFCYDSAFNVGSGIGTTRVTVPSDPYAQLQIHVSTRGLNEDEISAIAQHVEVVRYQEGEVVLHPNDRVDALYLVSAGRFRLAIVLSGDLVKTISYASRDDQFGVLALHGDEPSQIKVVATRRRVAFGSKGL